MASAGQSNAQCPHINCVFPLCPGPVSAGHPDTTGHMHTEPRQSARLLGIYQKLLVEAKCSHQLFGDEIFWEKIVNFCSKYFPYNFPAEVAQCAVY